MAGRLAALGAVALVLALPGAGAGGADGEESRVRVACLGGVAELRLRAEDEGDDDGTIEIELRVGLRRQISPWRVVLLHERQLVFQGLRRASHVGYAFQLRRVVPDWPGRESVTARLTAPSGRTCRLSASI